MAASFESLLLAAAAADAPENDDNAAFGAKENILLGIRIPVGVANGVVPLVAGCFVAEGVAGGPMAPANGELFHNASVPLSDLTFLDVEADEDGAADVGSFFRFMVDAAGPGFAKGVALAPALLPELAC
jgi:hypothetical protein